MSIKLVVYVPLQPHLHNKKIRYKSFVFDSILIPKNQNTYTLTHVPIHIYIHTYTYTYIYTYTLTYIYISIHTHHLVQIHSYLHTYILHTYSQPTFIHYFHNKIHSLNHAYIPPNHTLIYIPIQSSISTPPINLSTT